MEELNWELFFEEWKQKYGIHVFAKDGIICPAEYEEVLFVLKDVHNASKDQAIDLRNSLQSAADEGRTWFPAARWAAVLLDGKPAEDMTHPLQHQYMRRIAVMNLKKEAGGPTVSREDVMQYAESQREEILSEIQACHPRMVLACSHDVFDALAQKVFMLGEDYAYRRIELSDKMRSYGRCFDISSFLGSNSPVYVIEYRHPNQCGKQGTVREHDENMLRIRKFLLGR